MVQTTCSNDISLLYPWLHITDTLLDIKTWLRRQTNRTSSRVPTPPPPLLSGSLGRHGKLETPTVANMRIVQVIVITVFPAGLGNLPAPVFFFCKVKFQCCK